MDRTKGKLTTISCFCTVGFVCALLTSVAAARAESKTDNSDNAALLYYQAFLLCPYPDDIPREVGAVFHAESGGDAGRYREYVKDYHNVIQLVEAASQISQCNWAIPYWEGGQVRSKLMRLTRSLVLLTGANVRVLAADGNYAQAFADSLMLRRVARHIADDPGAFDPVPVDVERTALLCVHLVLEVMPADERILRSLREELCAQAPVTELLPRRITDHFERSISAMKKDNAKTLSNLRQEIAEKTKSETRREQVTALTDDELLRLVREPYAEFMDSVLETMRSDISYERKCARIENMVKAYQERAKDNAAVIPDLQNSAESVLGLYRMQVTHTALWNATMAAIEIYLAKATTDRLPEALPEGLPKDPFSGRDFEYKATKGGFVLCSRGKDFTSGEVRQYEFKVRK